MSSLAIQSNLFLVVHIVLFSLSSPISFTMEPNAKLILNLIGEGVKAALASTDFTNNIISTDSSCSSPVGDQCNNEVTDSDTDTNEILDDGPENTDEVVQFDESSNVLTKGHRLPCSRDDFAKWVERLAIDTGHPWSVRSSDERQLRAQCKHRFNRKMNVVDNSRPNQSRYFTGCTARFNAYKSMFLFTIYGVQFYTFFS